MRTLIIALIVALAGWIGGGSWYWTCKVKGHCGGGSVTSDSGDIPPADNPNLTPFTITYQDQPFLTANDNLRFGKSNREGRVPSQVGNAIDSLMAFLQANPDKDVEITGKFSEDESNASAFSNLGLARADFIGQMLIGQGLSDDRIIKSYEIGSGPNVFTAQDTMLGGIMVRLLDRPETEIASGETGEAGETGDDQESADETDTDGSSETARVADTPKMENRDLYFDYRSSNLTMDDDLRQYITRTIQYLKQNPDQNLVLTGHTDNKGAPVYNQQLGMDRARSVKKFFEDFGLAGTQILTESKGQSQPIESNLTDEGRSKNRRVEIRIK